MLRVVLVDDEFLARERLRKLLGQVEIDVEIVGDAASCRQAIPLIHETRPDLVFLDIQMPVLDGFDVLDLIAPPRPHIVFVTAYDAYALRAFEVHALDYLTKPVSRDRLQESLERITDLIAAKQAPDGLASLEEERSTQPLRRLTLHVGSRLRIVEPSDVRYFEARDKVVFAHTEERDYFTDFTLQTLEQRLDGSQFLRIHRSYLINVATIRELTPWFSGTYQVKLTDGTLLPVSRRRVKHLKTFLNMG